MAAVDVAMVVTFTGEREETWEYPYDFEEVQRILGPDEPVYQAPQTYFRARVDEIIYDEHSRLQPGDVIEIRAFGHARQGWLPADVEAPLAEEQRLILGGPNPDGSYAPNTGYHIFDIGGSSARFVVGKPSERTPGFTNAHSPAAFIAQIRAELARRGPSPVPPVDFDNLVPRPIAPPPSTQ